MRIAFFLLMAPLSFALIAPAQQQAPPADSGAALRINSRAVLVDVIVTDSNGKPVTGLKQDAFSLAEKGKAQTISYFEEHRVADQATQPVQPAKMPPNVFTNFSPVAPPPVVTVLLLDSLNTHMENQSFMHTQALKFLKSASPGSRMAIFGMGFGLRFIQGFSDDPSVLASALEKQGGVDTGAMLRGQENTTNSSLVRMISGQAAPGSKEASTGALGAISTFFQESDDSRTVDRNLLTLANLQNLASFLNSFPGRKDVIWFSEAFPLAIDDNIDARVQKELAQTVDALAAARVAIYPVDATGGVPADFFETDKTPSARMSAGLMSARNEALASQSHSANVMTMKTLAEATGGKAYSNNGGLARIMGDITASNGDFYTLSYSPSNTKMDGGYRPIEVKVQGGKYNLSYRRGYIAVDAGLPGSGDALRAKAMNQPTDNNAGAVDPLRPFMDLGMPPSQQIVYAERVQPVPVGDKAEPGDPKEAAARYTVDFAVNAKDLQVSLEPDGKRTGLVNVSLIAFDQEGKVVSRKDLSVAMHVSPEKWTLYQTTGVQLHAALAVPNGQYWLRTGIFDQPSQKVGTMEILLSAVQAAAMQAPKAEK